MECKKISLTNDFYVDCMLDNPFEGILAINKDGLIVFINHFFLKILGYSNENQVINQKIWNIIPNCNLYETVVTGYSNWGGKLNICDKYYYVSSFPLKKDGNIIGAMVKTLFPDLPLARAIAEKIHQKSNPNMHYKANFTCRDMIGESDPMLAVKRLARKASRSNSNLLITGESGTGKGVVAQAIHNRSARRDYPFVTVNCAAIPESLLESELFGYEEGAFTGAKKGGKKGKFELADGGTIFLDEIGDMPLSMQVKLLKVLQDKEVERVGSNGYKHLNVRVIAATNQNLRKLVDDKKFREDFYYRLNVLEINLPPLRERQEDLPSLVDNLIKKINVRVGADAEGVSDDTLEIMKKYQWPGNIRELENFLEKMINYSDDHILDVKEIPGLKWEKWLNSESENEDRIFHQKVEAIEKKMILEALKRSQGNKTKAAKVLKIPRSVLYTKMKKFGIYSN